MRKMILLCSNKEEYLKGFEFEINPENYEYIYFDKNEYTHNTSLKDMVALITTRLEDNDDERILVVKERLEHGFNLCSLMNRVKVDIGRTLGLLFLANVSYVQDKRTGTWSIEKYRDDISLEYPTQEDLKKVIDENEFYKSLLNQLNK